MASHEGTSPARPVFPQPTLMVAYGNFSIEAFVYLALHGTYAVLWLIISRRVTTPAPILALAIALVILGTFLHYVSDAQKHYTLRAQPGLITDGLT